MENRIEYRGYTIEDAESPWNAIAPIQFYMDENMYFARSVEEAKEEIDEIIYDRENWKPEPKDPVAWAKYEEELKAHNEYMEDIKPIRENFDTDRDFLRATNNWRMESAMRKPNEPGYFWANND